MPRFIVIIICGMGIMGCTPRHVAVGDRPVVEPTLLTVKLSDVRCTDAAITLNVDIVNTSDVPLYYCSKASPVPVEEEPGADGGYYLSIPTSDHLFVLWTMVQKPYDVLEVFPSPGPMVCYLAPGRTIRRTVVIHLPPRAHTAWDREDESEATDEELHFLKIHPRRIRGSSLTLQVFVGYWPGELVERGQKEVEAMYPTAPGDQTEVAAARKGRAVPLRLALHFPGEFVVALYRRSLADGNIVYDAETGQYWVGGLNTQLIAESNLVTIRLKGDGGVR